MTSSRIPPKSPEITATNLGKTGEADPTDGTHQAGRLPPAHDGKPRPDLNKSSGGGIRNNLNKKWNTGIFDAFKTGDFDSMKRLLMADASQLSVLNEKGETPTIIAVSEGNAEALELIVRYAKPGQLDIARPLDGATPLHLAVFHGDPKAVMTLLGDGKS